MPNRDNLIPSQPYSLDSERIDNPVIGFSAMLLSILLFSLMDANVKWLGAIYPTAQIMFFRCAVALVPVLVIVAMRGGIGVLRTQQKKLHLLRSLMGIMAMGLAFYAFSLMPLAEAVSILHTAPLFMTALSVLLLRESVGIRRWSALVLGFIGMLLVVRPGTDMLASGSLYMLMAAFLIGCTSIVIRHLGKMDDPVCITFYFTVTGVILSLAGMLMQGWETPEMTDLALLMLVGLLGGLAQYLMTLSYQHLALGAVAPLKYLTIVFSGTIAYLVWGEVPDLQSVVGIGIIILTGLYTLHREMVRRTEHSR
ncbi:MAG: DMT family transporter [Gammaproteobacteria bacterium]|nr:DMT family transporter [Gammaproteobacteria bacterium]